MVELTQHDELGDVYNRVGCQMMQLTHVEKVGHVRSCAVGSSSRGRGTTGEEYTRRRSCAGKASVPGRLHRRTPCGGSDLFVTRASRWWPRVVEGNHFWTSDREDKERRSQSLTPRSREISTMKPPNLKLGSPTIESHEAAKSQITKAQAGGRTVSGHESTGQSQCTLQRYGLRGLGTPASAVTNPGRHCLGSRTLSEPKNL